MIPGTTVRPFTSNTLRLRPSESKNLAIATERQNFPISDGQSFDDGPQGARIALIIHCNDLAVVQDHVPDN